MSARDARAQKCRCLAPARVGGGGFVTQVCVAIHHSLRRQRATRHGESARMRRACPDICAGRGGTTRSHRPTASERAGARERKGDNRNDEGGEGNAGHSEGSRTSRTLLLQRTRIYAAQLHPTASIGASPIIMYPTWLRDGRQAEKPICVAQSGNLDLGISFRG